MTQLDEKVKIRMSHVQQKKISDIHQKTHLIKDYDAILKKIDRQLGKSTSVSAEIPSEFYLTDVAHMAAGSKRTLPQQSPKSKKIAAQVEFLRENAENWEKQAEVIKEKAQANNLNQIEVKVQEEHNQHFHQYNYLNQRYNHLDELKKTHEEILSKKNELLEKYIHVPPSKKAKETQLLQEKHRKSAQESLKYQTQLKNMEEMYERLKEFVTNFGAKSGHHLEMEGEVTWENMSFWLEEILKMKNRLRNEHS